MLGEGSLPPFILNKPHGLEGGSIYLKSIYAPLSKLILLIDPPLGVVASKVARCILGYSWDAAPAIGGTASAQSMLRMRQNPRAPEVDLQAWAGVGFLLNY